MGRRRAPRWCARFECDEPPGVTGWCEEHRQEEDERRRREDRAAKALHGAPNVPHGHPGLRVLLEEFQRLQRYWRDACHVLHSISIPLSLRRRPRSVDRSTWLRRVSEDRQWRQDADMLLDTCIHLAVALLEEMDAVVAGTPKPGAADERRWRWESVERSAERMRESVRRSGPPDASAWL